MGKLYEKKLVFIAGIAGSGTTMMLKFLSHPDVAIALGGNYVSPEYKTQAEIVNNSTHFIWDDSLPNDYETRKEKKEIIKNIEISDQVTHVIYKRSFPFVDMEHFPDLRDLNDFSKDLKIIVMERDPTSCTSSIKRRGMAASIEEAARNTKESLERLNSDLEKVDKSLYATIPYEDFIKEPYNYVDKLESFLDFPKGVLRDAVKSVIKKPTRHSRIIKKFHSSFLNKFFKESS